VKIFSFCKDLIVVALVGAFIGYLAPFGMHTLPVYVSVFYWSVICILGYCIYKPVINCARQRLKNSFVRQWPRVAIATLVASVLMSLALPVVTWLFFGGKLDIGGQFFQIWPKTIVIGGVLTLISMAREQLNQQGAKIVAVEKAHEALEQKLNTNNNAGYEKLMLMLPIAKRGKLLCLQMDDHYLKVTTSQGQHLVLMRFKDALQLLQDYAGFQTHRSWWVALDAVNGVKREGRKHILILAEEMEVPVSNTYEL